MVFICSIYELALYLPKKFNNNISTCDDILVNMLLCSSICIASCSDILLLIFCVTFLIDFPFQTLPYLIWYSTLSAYLIFSREICSLLIACLGSIPDKTVATTAAANRYQITAKYCTHNIHGQDIPTHVYTLFFVTYLPLNK